MALSLPDWALARPFWGDEHPALGSVLAGRSGFPKHPPASKTGTGEPGPGVGGRWQGQAGSIPVSLLQASGEELPGGGEEGRKEEGRGRGSRGDGPVRAAWLLSIEGAYHCHCLGLITGTCLQPRRLPAGVITSNRAGLGSPVQPRGFIAARNPALSALPQHHPTGLPAASPGTRCPVHPATGAKQAPPALLSLRTIAGV